MSPDPLAVADIADIAAVADELARARRVVLVPGYGLAVAQAQHALAHLAGTLRRRGTTVEIAVHPVAGRMPGQLNVLLDAAGVAWSDLRDGDTAEFDGVDVALLVGANDVVNPALRMPVFPVERAHRVVALLRSAGPGFAGVENRVLRRATVLLGDALELLLVLVRETEQAVAGVPQPGDDVADVVEPLVEPGDDDRD
ncbi:NAD(P)(+) transhydrogenase (Re/Si-specific) subunit beta [Sporichthya polymorpha]|uniref:NAD(P)(+) transhydrogenase (Re/Si-specific) subunit beta n=1 Tax=Sporichthya polymorpha TaxID=35751 RepID=UPI000368EE16|nr:NAD(P)(+) transhydrogenase (Re/Si-specific) subunit beta [Sporichthya polymorpha]